MRKRSYRVITACIVVLCLLVIALLMVNSLRRSSHITLPDAAAASSVQQENTKQADESVTKIEVTPETVQLAIRTLKRPDSYVRSLTVERLWSGGSGSEQISTAVNGEWTRTDTTQTSGRVRHTITNGETTYIWYDSSQSVYIGQAGDISADDEQGIPTYETILHLDPNSIAAADYRTFSDESSIYVETAENGAGYVLRYWVSVSSGLLIGAEKLQNGETVYRMAAQPIDSAAPTAADFTLPDGTVLPAFNS